MADPGQVSAPFLESLPSRPLNPASDPYRTGSKARVIASDLKLAAECLRDARLLLKAESRNAAYLASQAAEHVVRAIATSEDLHIERKDALQLDTTVRRIPDTNADRESLRTIAFLEIYATTYRYPTSTGRTPNIPPIIRIETALDTIDKLISTLIDHFGVVLRSA